MFNFSLLKILEFIQIASMVNFFFRVYQRFPDPQKNFSSLHFFHEIVVMEWPIFSIILRTKLPSQQVIFQCDYSGQSLSCSVVWWLILRLVGFFLSNKKKKKNPIGDDNMGSFIISC